MVKSLDGLPLILKLLLWLLIGPIIYGLIYRICKGNVLGAIVMFLLYCVGIGYIVDLITIITSGKPTVLA